jgi:hypothetical protein
MPDLIRRDDRFHHKVGQSVMRIRNYRNPQTHRHVSVLQGQTKPTDFFHPSAVPTTPPPLQKGP